jgi:hypothetical protein
MGYDFSGRILRRACTGAASSNESNYAARFCIVYILQFVHKKILKQLKLSDVSFSSVSEFDSYPRLRAARKKPEMNTFLLNPRSVPVSRGLPRAGNA